MAADYPEPEVENFIEHLSTQIYKCRAQLQEKIEYHQHMVEFYSREYRVTTDFLSGDQLASDPQPTAKYRTAADMEAAERRAQENIPRYVNSRDVEPSERNRGAL